VEPENLHCEENELSLVSEIVINNIAIIKTMSSKFSFYFNFLDGHKDIIFLFKNITVLILKRKTNAVGDNRQGWYSQNFSQSFFRHPT
jgi:hypothetical protein